MLTRNQTILSLSRLSALLLLVVLLLLNVAAVRTSARMDLTEDGIYTLSDASKHILASLEDPVSIKVFWHNVPEEGEIARRYVDSILSEMKAAAGGRLSVRWVDVESEDGKKEAEDAGVQVLQFSTAKEGEIRATEGYSSLVLEVGDAREPVDNLVQMGTRLEYEVISQLHRMTRKDEFVVGLVANRPPVNPFAGTPSGRFNAIEYFLGEHLGKDARLSLTLDEPVPPDVDVLILAGPRDLPEKAVYHFEQFLLRGGRAVVLVDPVHANLGEAPNTQAESSGLEEWLAHLGITVESGVVGDFQWMQRRPRLTRTRIGTIEEHIPYPYWPLVVAVDREGPEDARGLDQSNPATRGFKQLPLYWPAAISIDRGKQTLDGRTVSVLGATTESGYHRRDLIGLDRTREDVDPADYESAIPLMVLVDGPMESFWKGRAAPGEEEKPAEGEEEPAGGEEKPAEGEEEPAEGEEKPADEEVKEEKEEGPPRLETGNGLFVLLTDAEVVDDQAFRLNRGIGVSFVLNLVDWMGGSEELLALRAREGTSRQIEAVEAEKQDLIKWLNAVSVPLLVLMAGVVVWIVRRYQS